MKGLQHIHIKLDKQKKKDLKEQNEEMNIIKRNFEANGIQVVEGATFYHLLENEYRKNQRKV